MDEIMVNFIRSQPAPERPEGLTDELIKLINDEHIERYSKMLSVYHPDIRRGEVKRYLSIHMQVRAIGENWAYMDKLGKNEILDVWFSEYADQEED